VPREELTDDDDGEEIDPAAIGGQIRKPTSTSSLSWTRRGNIRRGC
jgi:hypothetical protein